MAKKNIKKTAKNPVTKKRPAVKKAVKVAAKVKTSKSAPKVKTAVKSNVAKQIILAPKQQEHAIVKSLPEDTKPLSKQEINELKDKLVALKDEILSQIKEISDDTLSKSQTEATGENSAYTLDAATDNYDREFNFRLVSGDRELLLEIDAALKKIDAGEYGICVMCDKLIGRTRLSVIPYATHCRQCKEQLEKEGKL